MIIKKNPMNGIGETEELFPMNQYWNSIDGLDGWKILSQILN